MVTVGAISPGTLMGTDDTWDECPYDLPDTDDYPLTWDTLQEQRDPDA